MPLAVSVVYCPASILVGREAGIVRRESWGGSRGSFGHRGGRVPVWLGTGWVWAVISWIHFNSLFNLLSITHRPALQHLHIFGVNHSSASTAPPIVHLLAPSHWTSSSTCGRFSDCFRFVHLPTGHFLASSRHASLSQVERGHGQSSVFWWLLKPTSGDRPVGSGQGLLLQPYLLSGG